MPKTCAFLASCVQRMGKTMQLMKNMVDIMASCRICMFFYRYLKIICLWHGINAIKWYLVSLRSLVIDIAALVASRSHYRCSRCIVESLRASWVNATLLESHKAPHGSVLFADVLTTDELQSLISYRIFDNTSLVLTLLILLSVWCLFQY